ncbi:hypothetical protein GCM10011409_37900 [Lentibacillus populi]|uniref:Uncharacterized protein n=1 Tax=Lentibacillus populi TaxID=1827502 RepID=A0A9W5U0N8_9BACI|nr:hypothetical protein GCM10011409_37900 [Lentibacillus populi]
MKKTMKIIVNSLNREITKMYGDNKTMEILPTNNISVNFTIAVNG